MHGGLRGKLALSSVNMRMIVLICGLFLLPLSCVSAPTVEQNDENEEAAPTCRRECDPNLCPRQHEYPDPYSGCICKPCCYTTDEQIRNNDNIVCECREKDQTCANFPLWSACPRNNPKLSAPPDAPVSSYCSNGKTTAAVITTNGPPTPIRSEDSTDDDITQTGTVANPTDPSVVDTTSTDEDITRNQTEPANIIDPSSLSTNMKVAIAVIVALLVGLFIVISARCCCRPRCGESKDSVHAASELPPQFPVTPDEQVLLPENTNSSPDQLNSNTSLAAGSSTSDSACLLMESIQGTVENENENSDATTPPPLASSPNHESSDSSNNKSTASSQDLSEHQESGYFSTPSSTRSQSESRTSTSLSTRTVLDFAWNQVEKFQQELKDSCDSKQSWQAALHAQAAEGVQVTLDGLSAAGLSTDPSYLIQAFTGKPFGAQAREEEQVVSLLSVMKNCQWFHPPATTDSGVDFEQTIDKMTEIFTKLQSEDIESLNDHDEQEITCLIGKLREHPDFKIDMSKKKVGNPATLEELQEQVASLGSRVIVVEKEIGLASEGQPVPELTRFSFECETVLFIEWNKDGYKNNKSSFQLQCNKTNCDKCHQPYFENFDYTPMAYSFLGLEPNHNYKLIAKMGAFTHELAVETKATKCTNTFCDLRENSGYLYKLAVCCDHKKFGPFRQQLVSLLKCSEDELSYMEFHTDYLKHCLIDMILAKQDQFPIAVLMYCLFHCGMYNAISLLSEWHGNCDICSELYRIKSKEVSGKCH